MEKEGSPEFIRANKNI